MWLWLKLQCLTILLLVAPVFIAGCNSRVQDNFNRIRIGDSSIEVVDLIGEPSSRIVIDTRLREDGDIDYSQRWQWGDNLSTLATGVAFPLTVPDRVWAIFFDQDLQVLRTSEPTWLDQ